MEGGGEGSWLLGLNRVAEKGIQWGRWTESMIDGCHWMASHPLPCLICNQPT